MEKRRFEQEMIVEGDVTTYTDDSRAALRSHHAAAFKTYVTFGIAALIVLVILIAALVGLFGNLKQYIATAGAFMQLVFNLFIPGIIGASLIFLCAKTYKGYRAFTLDKVELARLRDENMRENNRANAEIALMQAQAAEIWARASQLAHTLPVDERGNLVYLDRVSGQIVQIAGQKHDFPQLTSYHNNNAANNGKLAIASPSEIIPAKFAIPEMYDLLDVVKGSDLSPDRLFVGKSADGRMLYVDAIDGLCHGAFNAVTGRGKTVIVRGLEAQLLAMRLEVIHADVKFTLQDKKGNDYRPIARALLSQGDLDINGRGVPHLMIDEAVIVNMVNWLADTEIPRRLELFHDGDHSYSTLYLFLEELAYLCEGNPEIGPKISKILTIGRELGVKVFTAAQNFQAQNLKINGGMRKNFESAWFLGGDTHSGAAMLDMSEKELKRLIAENNVELGKGVNVFRNNAIAYEACLMRAGFASNDFVYYLLGKADGLTLPGRAIPEQTGGRGYLRSVPGYADSTRVTIEPEPSYHAIRNVPETRHDEDLAAFQEGRATDRSVLEKPVNRTTEPSERILNAYRPGPGEKMLDELEQKILIAHYQDCGSVAECLSRMHKGVGTYRNHAVYVLDTLGLRNKKRA